MKRTILIVLFFLLLGLIGCRQPRLEHKHAPVVRSGILKIGINMKAFLDVWGNPERTKTVTSEEFVRAGWSTSGGGFYKGRKPLQVWTYEKIGIELVFDGDTLAGWKTDKTVEELKAAAKPLPSIKEQKLPALNQPID